MILGIFSTIGEIVAGPADEAVGKIKDFFGDFLSTINDIFEFITSVCNIFPTPFNVIFPLIIGTIFSISMYKLITSLT